MEYKLVSADAHFIEPPNLWKDWLPAKWQQIAPKLVKDKDGGDAWDYGAGEPSPLGIYAAAGKDERVWQPIPDEACERPDKPVHVLARLERSHVKHVPLGQAQPGAERLGPLARGVDPRVFQGTQSGATAWGGQHLRPGRDIRVGGTIETIWKTAFRKTV